MLTRSQIEIPVRFGFLVGYLAEVWTWLTGGTTTISRGSVLDACAMRYASGEKARRLLGYEARVSLQEGLKRSCKVSGLLAGNIRAVASLLD